jgi:ATP-dependent RNA helicase DeaD
MLPMIERATRSKIAEMPLPSADAIADKRLTRFHAAITKTLAEADLEAARGAVENYLARHEVEAVDLAAALAEMLRGEGAPAEDIPVPRPTREFEPQRAPRGEIPTRQSRDRAGHRTREVERGPRAGHGPPTAMETYRLEVGTVHGVKAGNILGAIANEANLTGRDIGRIELHEEFSTVDLPEGMPKAMFQHLKKVRVAGRPLNLSLLKPTGKG